MFKSADHFPHTCGLCGSPSYTGDFSTDCSKPGCGNHQGDTIAAQEGNNLLEGLTHEHKMNEPSHNVDAIQPAGHVQTEDLVKVQPLTGKAGKKFIETLLGEQPKVTPGLYRTDKNGECKLVEEFKHNLDCNCANLKDEKALHITDEKPVDPSHGQLWHKTDQSVQLWNGENWSYVLENPHNQFRADMKVAFLRFMEAEGTKVDSNTQYEIRYDYWGGKFDMSQKITRPIQPYSRRNHAHNF